MLDLSYQPSPFQQRVMSVPENYDLALLGGRGSSKSVTMSFLALNHLARWQRFARILYLRRTFASIENFLGECNAIFKQAYGNGVSLNRGSMRFTFDHDGFMWMRPLDDPHTYDVLQGASFSLVMVDEVGQYPNLNLVERVRSNMRGPKEMPLRMIYASNPGGPCHYLLGQRFANAQPWVPTKDTTSKSGREFVYCPSTYRDNPYINQEEYHANLVDSAHGNEDLIRAWVDGDWGALTAGNFFAQQWSPARNILHIPVKNIAHLQKEWRAAISVDHGSAAPCSVGLYLKSPGAKMWDKNQTYVPKDSVICIDEFHTAKDDLVTGINYGIPRICENIKKMWKAWGLRNNPSGCGDDAMFSNLRGGQAATIADEYRLDGVNLTPAKKGSRAAGWERMSRMMADAGKGNGRPGLYLNDVCKYAIATLPILGRDERDPEDLDSSGPDHFADQCRYFLNWSKPQARSIWLSGAP